MGKHTPSTEELESAIADVLEAATEENLTAQQVRELLQKEHEDWKVPGERRVAKFINRRSSTKKKKSRKDKLFSMFKSAGGKNDASQNGHDNSQKPALETHPGNSKPSTPNDKERKGGLKKSIVRVLSPPGRNKKTKKTTTFENFQSFKDEPSIKFISEIDESERPSYDDTEKLSVPCVSVNEGVCERPGASPIRSKPTQPPPKTPPLVKRHPSPGWMAQPPQTKEEKESVTTSPSDSVDETLPQKLSAAKEEIKNMKLPQKVSKYDAYSDDNDGKKGDCECEACTIM